MTGLDYGTLDEVPDAEQPITIPVPPLALRSITAAPEEDVFLLTGEADLAYLLGLYERYVQQRPTRPRVLDFGCGCGRLTRFLAVDARYEGVACDLNPNHVAWCRENIGNVETVVNAPAPPLPFADASIDFAYLLSVFTHLTEAAIMAWLIDLARVMRPGGIVAITTHGYPAIDTIIGSEIHHQMYRIDAAGATDLRNRLAGEGFIHLPYGEDVLKLANVGTDYGNSFIHPDYARRRWSAHLHVVDHLPGGLRGGWQDVFLLAARAV